MMFHVERLKYLFANLLAATLDFSVGVFGISLLAYLYNYELAVWQVFLGGVLALLPDLDLVPTVLLGTNSTFDHRQTLFHRPILILPAAVALSWVLGGQFWAIAAGVLVFWHFLHDTDWFGDRYGVAWFWPVSNRFWSIHGSYSPPVVAPHHSWLEANWLQPSVLSLRELGVSLCLLSATFGLQGLANQPVVWLGLVVSVFFVVILWFSR
jgi:hypothetical protein